MLEIYKKIAQYKKQIKILAMLESVNPEDRKFGINLLRKSGIIQKKDSIYLFYSGSGDSGGVYDIKVYGQFKNLDFVDANADDFLEYIDYDWYNNEGGQGTIILDLYNGTVSVSGTYNEVVESCGQETTVNVTD